MLLFKKLLKRLRLFKMKNFIFLFSLLSSTAFAQYYHFEIHETMKNVEHRWVRLNDDSGASCQMQPLATLKVAAILGEDVLVQYQAPYKGRNGDCEDLIKLVLPGHYLDTIRSESRIYMARKRMVENILLGNTIQSYGGHMVGDRFGINYWSWVIVESPIGKFRELDLCRILGGNEVAIRGFWVEKKQVLFSYTGSAGDYAECPEGTLYFDTL